MFGFLVTKPATTHKAQLFRVKSNQLLQENHEITLYQKDPFFEDRYILKYHDEIDFYFVFDHLDCQFHLFHH